MRKWWPSPATGGGDRRRPRSNGSETSPSSLSKVGEASAAAKDCNGALAAFEEGVAIRQQIGRDRRQQHSACRPKSPPRKNGSATSSAMPATRPARSPPMSRAWTSAGRSAMPCSAIRQRRRARRLRAGPGAGAALGRGRHRQTNYLADVSSILESIASIKLNSGDSAGALAGYRGKPRHSPPPRRRRRRPAPNGDRTSPSRLEKIGDLKHAAKDDAGADRRL